MLTLDRIVARIAHQFDASSQQVAQWANERQARMVAESLWRAVERRLAVTVAGQAVYPVEPEMVDLRGLRVGPVVYGSASREQLWALDDPAAGAVLNGPGVYAPWHGRDGEWGVELRPVPSQSGLEVVGLMAYEPPELVRGSDRVVIPTHLHSRLLDGVIASAYEELDGRWDLAEPHEQRYEEGIVRLGRLRVSRVGGGPVQARVAGYHFRVR